MRRESASWRDLVDGDRGDTDARRRHDHRPRFGLRLRSHPVVAQSLQRAQRKAATVGYSHRAEDKRAGASFPGEGHADIALPSLFHSQGPTSEGRRAEGVEIGPRPHFHGPILLEPRLRATRRERGEPFAEPTAGKRSGSETQNEQTPPRPPRPLQEERTEPRDASALSLRARPCVIDQLARPPVALRRLLGEARCEHIVERSGQAHVDRGGRRVHPEATARRRGRLPRALRTGSGRTGTCRGRPPASRRRCAAPSPAWICSGAAYLKLPMKSPAFVRLRSSTLFVTPKSARNGVPSSATRMFRRVTSRWIKPFA